MNVIENAISLQFFAPNTALERRTGEGQYLFELCEAQRAPKPHPHSHVEISLGGGIGASALGPFVPRRNWVGRPSLDWSAPCLLALTNAQDGRETEFDDWYWNQHFPDGLRLPGCFAGRRYERAEKGSGAYRHLAVYQFDLDDMAIAVEAVAARSGTPEMPLTDAISSVFQAWFVSPSMR